MENLCKALRDSVSSHCYIEAKCQNVQYMIRTLFLHDIKSTMKSDRDERSVNI